MLLALTIASASLNLFYRGLMRLCEREAQKVVVHDSGFGALPKSKSRNYLRGPARVLSMGGWTGGLSSGSTPDEEKCRRKNIRAA